MEEAEARKLQPHFIRSFFLEAFRLLGGQITKREPGRYEITNVPAEIRTAAKAARRWRPGRRPLRAGHVREASSSRPPASRRHSSSPRAIRCSTRPSTSSSSATGRCSSRARSSSRTPTRARIRARSSTSSTRSRTRRELADGQRQVVSKRLQFVELTQDWEPRLAGYAPYLDYRPIEPEELDARRSR